MQHLPLNPRNLAIVMAIVPINLATQGVSQGTARQRTPPGLQLGSVSDGDGPARIAVHPHAISPLGAAVHAFICLDLVWTFTSMLSRIPYLDSAALVNPKLN